MMQPIASLIDSSKVAVPGDDGNTPAGILDALRRARPTLWTGRHAGREAEPASIGLDDVRSARARFERFAPLLARLFPELAACAGAIESELLEASRMQQRLGFASDRGALLVKADHALPVAGSVKARGGIHEVLEFAETCAQRHGLLADGDYQALATPAARAVLSRYEVAVGSTGNLGLAIGVMASALGLRAIVHMSADAKAWKKERLRRRGVAVIEHAGDYAEAVASGRREAAANPNAHFVDDEHSPSLFLGYAAAAQHFALQLEERGRAVDAEHPLFVYLPCGVGGAPGGIATGLHQVYGPNVHCFFAEPVQSPCFLLQMLVDSGQLTELGAHPSIYDIGLNNQTEADGLAVPSASNLAAGIVKNFLGGVYTVEDETLFRRLHDVHQTEGIRIEPSAAAAFAGPQQLLGSRAGQDYLRRQNLLSHLGASTHVAWTTGGLCVPEDEYARFLGRGAALSPG